MSLNKKQNIITRILKVYMLVLSIYFIFRLILFFTELHRIDFAEVKITTIIKSFIMGVRFDTVISSYIMALPVLILLILDIFKKKNKFLETIIFYWIFILFSVTFIFSSVDIPYFSQFFSRLTIGAFAWFDSLGFVFKMIAQEPKYFLIILPLIIIVLLFKKLLKRMYFKEQNYNYTQTKYKIPITLIVLALVFLGIRGRMERKSPIRVGTAYFCNHSFLNQLGLNPTFTLLRSYLDSKSNKNKSITLMNDELAIAKTKKSLQVPSSNFISPIARKITPDSISINKPNIILVTMESMSAAKMKYHGNKHNLTPFLDSLVYKSLYFENIYTAGKHTFNGIFSTNYSYPALYRQHPMKNIRKFYGMPSVLKNQGYSTTFFINHDTQFDNVEGFLRANDFDNVIGQKDYPTEEVKTTLGVPDDYMFRYAIPKLNELHKENKPFFVSMMTASDHGPFYLPEYFKPHNDEIKKQMVEYADWSLKQLFKMASKQEWYDNTIFILIADHGEALSAPYDISLDYHHSPLIIYAPKLINPIIKKQIGGQIDVFPTVMGILNLPYINNTLGIDLLKESRPYIFINDDNKVGVLNDSLFMIMKDKEKSKLFKYQNGDKHNYAQEYPEQILEMENYIKHNLQTYQYMLKNEKLLTIEKNN